MSEHDPIARPDEDRLLIGASAIERDGAGWKITVAERAMPSRTRVAGTITIVPEAPPLDEARIGSDGKFHGWQVRAPRARVRADFARPTFHLDALGYHDRNHGEGRLEDSFSRWGWARFHGPRATTVVYSTVARDGRRHALLACAEGEDRSAPIAVPAAPEGAPRKLPWGLLLPARFGAGDLSVEPGALLETAPFYARYQALLHGAGPPLPGVGEHLDLDRFRSRTIQFLMRYKIRNGFFR